MTTHKYPAVFYYHEGGYINVQFPDLLENNFPAHTGGDSPEEAIENALDVLDIMVAFAKEEGLTLPEPSRLECVNIDRGREFDESIVDRIEVLHIEI